MLDNTYLLLGLASIFAGIPVAIWLYIFFIREKKSKKTMALVFGVGCFTAPALLGLQYVWDISPRFNLSTFIETSITSQNSQFIAMFMLFAAMEEIIKMYVVVAIDKRTTLIQTIGDSVRFSTAAALGFSFTENVYYLYEFWPSISLGELIGMYIFRSVFTMCAHMIFSGIFGYFYGIGKFSIYVRAQEKIAGAKNKIAQIISKMFGLPISQAYQQKLIVKGLILAVTIHATYNYVLQYNMVLPVIIFVVLGYMYLKYLLNRKAGHLILMTDVSNKSPRTIAKKDEDVVVELLGMWFKDEHYVDVLHICERLLERDPDNTVVKLFKAKAMDKMDDKSAYKKILGSVVKTGTDLNENDKNIISRHLHEKEMQNKVKNMIKKQMEKEGKTFIDMEKVRRDTEKNETNNHPQNANGKNYLDQFTQGDSFKI